MMTASVFDVFLPFVHEFISLASSELILFAIAVAGYLMTSSFSTRRTTTTKSVKVCDEVTELSDSDCTSKEIMRRFDRGDYQGVVALWPAVMCSDCVPGGAAFVGIVESLQRVGVQVQCIVRDVRRALKQNQGLCADTHSLCCVVEDLRNRACTSLLDALLCMFEELASDLGSHVLELTARATVGLHLSEGNTTAAESIMNRYSSLQSLVSSTCTGNPIHEVPSLTEQYGRYMQCPESNCSVVACQLGDLPVGLVADIFAFTEVSDVLACAGLSCRGLHFSIWRQPDFWVALGGPTFSHSMEHSGRPTTIVPMLNSFRRWVFGLDGDWSLQVEQLGSVGHPSDVLRAVLGYVQVLKSGDAELSDVWRLVRAAQDAMHHIDVQDTALLGRAAELVSTCRMRKDIFGSIDCNDLGDALQSLEKRAEQHGSNDERNQWFFDWGEDQGDWQPDAPSDLEGDWIDMPVLH